MQKFLLLSLVVFLFAYEGPLFAASIDDKAFSDSMFYDCTAVIELSKPSYNAGGVLDAKIKLYNLADYPVNDVRVIVEIVYGGGDHVYPASVSENDNVFYERVNEGLVLPSKSALEVPFSYTLPVDLKRGDYRFEVYLSTARTPLVGVSPIFMSPANNAFWVEGTGEFPIVRISRMKTVFLGSRGQTGPSVDADLPVNGEVYIDNPSSASLEGGELDLSVCAWDDINCLDAGAAFKNQYPLNVAAGGTVKIPVTFLAPDKPQAYAVRLELLDSGGRMLSLYRSRFVVRGAVTIVRKLVLNKDYYEAGEEGRIALLVGASPDMNMSVFDSKVSVYIVRGDGVEAFRTVLSIPELSERIESEKKIISFKSPFELSDYTVCSETASGSGESFDKYCFSVNVSSSVPKKPLEPTTVPSMTATAVTSLPHVNEEKTDNIGLYLFGVVILALLLLVIAVRLRGHKKTEGSK